MTPTLTKPARLNIHHPVQNVQKSDPPFAISTQIRAEPQTRRSLIIRVFNSSSPWKTPTLESLQRSTVETWDFGDLITGGKLWGRASAQGSRGIFRSTLLLYWVSHDDKALKFQRLYLSTTPGGTESDMASFYVYFLTLLLYKLTEISRSFR